MSKFDDFIERHEETISGLVITIGMIALAPPLYQNYVRPAEAEIGQKVEEALHELVAEPLNREQRDAIYNDYHSMYSGQRELTLMETMATYVVLDTYTSVIGAKYPESDVVTKGDIIDEMTKHNSHYGKCLDNPEAGDLILPGSVQNDAIGTIYNLLKGEEVQIKGIPEDNVGYSR